MSSSSDGSEMQIETMEEEEWTPVKRTRTGRRKLLKKAKHLSREQIDQIIGVNQTQQENTTKTSQISGTTKNILATKNTTTSKNYSPLMNEITHKKYKNMFYVTSDIMNTRVEFCDLWVKFYPDADDEIIKTKTGFLLKTNNEKQNITPVLTELIENKKINNFKETSPNIKTSTSSPTTSFSVVIGSVEQDIDEKTISDYLHKLQLEHRYCKRIISKTTQKSTSLIRIITGSQTTSEKLLQEGLFFKFRHYPVYPSKPPPPTPKPCNKCLSFTHPTELCNTPPKCTKCLGSHSINKCTSTLPPKCATCGSEDHQAWSFKCPRRPSKPIEGVPNVPIKSLNKKSSEITLEKKKSRIHSSVTVHDIVINTYINELNDTKNVDREELLIKLRKRFSNNYNIDTTAVFSGNRVYILMFDLDQENPVSPTEPIDGTNNIQHVQNVDG